MVAIAGLCLLAITPAGATGPTATIGQLQTADANLASKSRAAVLQLYSLDARLSTAQTRLATLRLDLRKLEQQQGWIVHERRIATLDTRLSQQRLASRLRFIYDHGTTTSLDILMGSESLGDALTQLDDVNKVAASNADVLGQVQSSRRHLFALPRTLAAHRRTIEAASAEAASTVSQLEQLGQARAGYIDDLAQQRSLDAQQITALTAQAQAASTRAQTMTSNATSRTQQAAAVISVPDATPASAEIDPPGSFPASARSPSSRPDTTSPAERRRGSRSAGASPQSTRRSSRSARRS